MRHRVHSPCMPFETILFNVAYIASLPVPPAPLKLRHYGALQNYYYYYYYYQWEVVTKM